MQFVYWEVVELEEWNEIESSVVGMGLLEVIYIYIRIYRLQKYVDEEKAYNSSFSTCFAF